MPVVPEDAVVDICRGRLKSLPPRELGLGEIPSIAETKNQFDQTNPKAKTERFIIIKLFKVVSRWLVEKQGAVRLRQVWKFLVNTTWFALFTYVFFSNVGNTLAHPGTLHKWPQIGETNDLYKGGAINISSVVFYKQEEMARKHLTEIATDIHECMLDGFYFLDQNNMFKEHLTENDEWRKSDQLCGVIEVRTLLRLEDHDCKDKLKFVCRFDGESSRSGDLVYNGAAYRLFHEKLTWFQARDYCGQLDGILATPNHVDETDALVNKFIDSFKKDVQKRLWIGLRKLDYCIDGTPALGIPWMEGEPIYPCVMLVKAVTKGVQAKTINCSTESSSTSEASPTSHTVQQTTAVGGISTAAISPTAAPSTPSASDVDGTFPPVPPAQCLSTHIIVLICMASFLAGVIINAVAKCLAGKFCPRIMTALGIEDKARPAEEVYQLEQHSEHEELNAGQPGPE